MIPHQVSENFSWRDEYTGDSYEDSETLIAIEDGVMIFAKCHKGPDEESRTIVRRRIRPNDD